jgi:hypothetical protein
MIKGVKIGTRFFECLIVSKKYLDHFSFDDLNGVTDAISFNQIGLIGLN